MYFERLLQEKTAQVNACLAYFIKKVVLKSLLRRPDIRENAL